MEGETRTLRLLCALTDEEIKIAGMELAQALGEIERIKAESSIIKKQAEQHQKNVERLYPVINAKAETREVECVEHFDWDRGVAFLVRTDTGEIVADWERPITEEERQQRFEM